MDFFSPYGVNANNFFSSLNLSWNVFNYTPIQGSYWSLWPEIRFYGIFLIFVIATNKFVSYNKRVFMLLTGLLAIQYFLQGNDTLYRNSV